MMRPRTFKELINQVNDYKEGKVLEYYELMVIESDLIGFDYKEFREGIILRGKYNES